MGRIKLIGRRQMDYFGLGVYMFTHICVCVWECVCKLASH